MIQTDSSLTAADLAEPIARMWELSAAKILSIEAATDRRGTPVFTVAGRYVAQGWTEWTQGFQFGSALLQYDATGDEQFLEFGRRNTLLFNGYAEQVANLYQGMDLMKNF